MFQIILIRFLVLSIEVLEIDLTIGMTYVVASTISFQLVFGSARERLSEFFLKKVAKEISRKKAFPIVWYLGR